MEGPWYTMAGQPRDVSWGYFGQLLDVNPSTLHTLQMKSWKRATFCHPFLKQQSDSLLQYDISTQIYLAFI
jgi:hypothetical protein